MLSEALAHNIQMSTGMKPSEDKPFTLDETFLSRYVNEPVRWGPVGYVTFKRTYARQLDTVSERHQQLAIQFGIGRWEMEGDPSGPQRRFVAGSEEWWLTVCRVVEGTYQIQQRHCRNMGLRWNADKAQRSAQEMYSLIFNFKFTPPGRGLWMMGTPYVDKVGGAALNNCFAKETRFWADGKLTSFEHLLMVGKDSVMVQTPLGQKQASVQCFGKQKLVTVEFKPHSSRSNHRLRFTATPNHRWLLLDGSETTSLKPGDLVAIDPVLHMKDTPDWRVGFAHGLIFGDGTRHTYYPDRHFIRLCGEKDAKHRTLLESMEGYVSTRPVRDSADVIVTIVRKAENWKQLPHEEQSLAYQAGFVEGWCAADGSRNWAKDGTTLRSTVLMSTDHQSLDWVAARAGMLGYCVMGDNTDSTTETNFGQRTNQIRKLTLVAGPCKYRVNAIVDEGREEDVFCVVEPETRSFMLEGGLITGNCAFASTESIDVSPESFAEPFTFLMDMSMLGVGVGFDTMGAGKIVIQQPVFDLETHVVEDSREGWVDLARRVLDAYTGACKLPVNVDYSRVRPYGALIRGFGGTAAGPGPLKELYELLTDLLNARIGQRITSTDIVDIANMIGRCVVAGNVRRSAEIAFGSPDDPDFLELKNYNKFPDQCARWRWASNNSWAANVGTDYTRAAELTGLNGEPGYFWLQNARDYGRMGRPPDFADRRVKGANPCVEQSLEDRELCCLAEVYPSNHESYEELERTLKFVYLYAKTVTLVPTHNHQTNAVMLRNRRIGVSQTGIIQAMKKFGRRQFLEMCDKGYAHLKFRDTQYSEWLAVPKSVKITSVKPSGTVSLLAGVTPGIHYPHSEYYYRVIRFPADSPLLTKLKTAGYRAYDLAPNEPNTTAVYFPVKERFFDRGKDEVTIWEQLENAAQMQQYWADNQVSITVTFKRDKTVRIIENRPVGPGVTERVERDVVIKGEQHEIGHALELYETRLKGVSFLPIDENGYSHAPYQTITKEEYDAYSSTLHPVDYTDTVNEVVDKFCDGGLCELPVRIA